MGILPQPDQQIEQSIPTQLTQHNPEPGEIPQLEENSEEEKYQDLDDDKYYQEVDRAYHTYRTPPAQDYRLANQAPGPH